MIRFLATLAVLLFISTTGFAQSHTIKGRIILGDVLKPVAGIHVGFSPTHKTETDAYGQFEITATRAQLEDTLTIFYLSFNTIQLINLPQDSSIDLGTIPVYEYSFGTPIIQFDCGSLNLPCKYRRRKFWKTFNRDKLAYFKAKNLEISKYRLILNGKLYAIDTDIHLIDFDKPVSK